MESTRNALPNAEVEYFRKFTERLSKLRLFDCNPFYLISSLLLIYSIYKISVGPRFLPTDKLQILFNFSSLESYSLALVLTALFLARRRIWYDATLLTAIENILVLIPFMLLSHASFVQNELTQVICVAGGLLGIGKLLALRRFFTGLNLPVPLLLCGALILVVNIAFPLAFRNGLNFPDNQWTNNELWKSRSLYGWYFLLPGLMFFGNLLPKFRADVPQQQAHEKQWLPLFIFGLWMSATTVHLYSIGYVDDQRFELSHFVPLGWAMSWLLCTSVVAYFRIGKEAARSCLLIPALVPLVPAIIGQPLTACALLAANACFFIYRALRRLDPMMSAWLSAASLFGALLTLPNEWMAHVIVGYRKEYLVLGLALLGGLVWSARMPTAKGALLGAISMAIFGFGLAGQSVFSMNLVLQLCLVFILIHSLWWTHPLERGSELFRFSVVGFWTIHSVVLQQQAVSLSYVPLFVAGSVAVFVLALRIFWQRTAYVLAFAVGIVLLVKPIYLGSVLLRDTPEGVLSLMASFALLIVGTLYALRRSSGVSARAGNHYKEVTRILT